MTILYITGFIFAAAGIIIALNITPKQIASDFMKFLGRDKLLAERMKIAKGEKKEPKLQALITDINYSLEITGSAGKFKFVCIASAILAFAASVLCLLIGQYFVLPVMVAIIAMIPYLFAKAQLNTYKKNVSLELETALSIVTTSYISKEDIITAIEESLPYTHHPIAEVFKRFIGRTRLINSSIKMAIRQMRQEIDDDIFHEWCDVLLECQENIGMKYTLQPIVAKYTDERIVNAELEAELAAEKSSFLMMIFLVLVNFPLLYFLNRDWFQVLVDTTQGKIVIAIVALVCFLTTLRMRKLTQPVKFKS